MPGSDSAGVPWAGRDLKANPFAGDTGESDAELLELMRLAAHSKSADRHRDVVAALATARLFVPIVATEAETDDTSDTLKSDKKSDMAMVTVAAPDGRRTVPAFTSVALLTAWNADARPVPVEAARVMLSAVSEQAQLVVIDPGSEHTYLVRRPAVWALAQGKQWTPSWQDPGIAAAVGQAAAAIPEITGTACRAGDETELQVDVTLVAGLGRADLDDAMARFQTALSEKETIAEGADSLAIGVHTACQ